MKTIHSNKIKLKEKSPPLKRDYPPIVCEKKPNCGKDKNHQKTQDNGGINSQDLKGCVIRECSRNKRKGESEEVVRRRIMGEEVNNIEEKESQVDEKTGEDQTQLNLL